MGGGQRWPEEATAQAFAWLDHCIDTNKDFTNTIVERLNSTTDKKHFNNWTQVYLHMANYAQKQVDDQTSPEIRAKLPSRYRKQCMDSLLIEGSSIVPNLTGDTPMANLIADIKASLAQSDDAGEAEVKEEDEDDEYDEAHNDVDMRDDDGDDDESTILLSSQSEYVGGGSQGSSDAASPGPSRSPRKKRPQSSTAELPAPKRARLATQIRQSRDLGEDELSVEEPSREGFVRRSVRPIIPAKSPKPRRAVEQQQEVPHSAPMVASEPHSEASSQEPRQQESPRDLRPLAINPTPPRQIHNEGLEDLEDVPVFNRATTIQESPQGGPTAEQNPESQQENSQARSTVVSGLRVVQSQNHTAGGPGRNPLAQENARVWQMYSHQKNKALAEMHTSSSLRMILSSPANNEQLLRTKYQQLSDRFITQNKMEEELADAENGQLQLRDNNLASRFKGLQDAILDACHPFELSNLEETLTPSGDDTRRDKKIELLTRTAFIHGARALGMLDEEDVDFFRGFITAHIFHFVFESDFPSRYTGHDNSPMLTEYRKVCFQQEGAKALYAKERVAMQNYLKERQVWHVDEEKKPFHDLVKIKAEGLAREVTELLAPLSMPTNIVADCLTPIYVDALKLKADMVMSNKNYTARFVLNGEAIDRESMTFENDFDRPNAKKVKQCVFPIIYAKPRPKIDGVDTELSECLINYSNFAVSESQYGRPSWTEGETMLCKGVMIL